eukprot:3099919-Ditylum_brightwellii.AAC.1
MNWFLELKRNGRRFIAPSVPMRDQVRLPASFSVYPDFKEACIKFIDNNTSDKKKVTMNVK